MQLLIKRIRTIAPWLGALVVVAVALLLFESDQLWKIQQYNVFLYSRLFFSQQMVVSGGLLTYVGALLTQFFFYPWMGVLLISVCWLLLMWLVKRTFRIPDRWSILAMVPVAILIIANMSLNYWIYFMKLHGYFYVPTLGAMAATSLLWLFRKLPENIWMRTGYVFLVCLLGYPLMGAYALATVVLMGVWTWRFSSNRTHNTILTLVSLLSVCAIPLLYYRFVYYQTNLADIYRTAIPVFILREDFPQYYIPYYLLAFCYLLYVICDGTEWKESAGKKPVARWALQGALAVVMAGCVCFFWYKDPNFHHELRMLHCMEQADWAGVLREGQKQETEPTRAIVMIHNLALSRLGRQCEEMYNFPKGSKKSNTSLPTYMFHIAARQLYYQYGLPNECHRMCMEEGVEYGWRTEVLQYMARCALLNKEPQAARKFLNLLRQTQFHGKWADHVEALLNHPEQIAEARETAPITHMMQYDNRAGSDNGYMEKFLMNLLADTDSDDPYFQEQAVIATLWTRDPRLFWARFIQYIKLRPNGTVPRIFQEAAYLFGNMEHRNNLEQMPFDQGVKI